MRLRRREEERKSEERLKEKERRLKIEEGSTPRCFSIPTSIPICTYIYIYNNDPSAPCIPDVREVKPLAESFLHDVPERLRVGEVL